MVYGGGGHELCGMYDGCDIGVPGRDLCCRGWRLNRAGVVIRPAVGPAPLPPLTAVELSACAWS